MLDGRQAFDHRHAAADQDKGHESGQTDPQDVGWRGPVGAVIAQCSIADEQGTEVLARALRRKAGRGMAGDDSRRAVARTGDVAAGTSL